MKMISLSCCVALITCLTADAQLFTISPPTNEFEQVLDGIKIPVVDFTSASLSDVTNFLAKTIEENKPATVTNRVKFVVSDDVDPGLITGWTLHAEDLSVFELIEMLQRVAALRCEMRDGVIAFRQGKAIKGRSNKGY